MSTQKNQSKTFRLVLLAMFSALATILYFIEVPLGMEHLKMDLSDIVALAGSVFYGPFFGIGVELIKNLIHLAIKGLGSQMGFGNLMNFIVGCAYIVPFTLLYNKLCKNNEKTRKNKIISFVVTAVVSVISIVAVGIGANYFIDPLFFRYFMHFELTSETLWPAIWSATLLNVIKGVTLSVVAYPLIAVLKKRLSSVLRID
ncbi:MAG: ECF transporter S component [Clostridiales bacterium]|nr:ECF transporter S component [Clostridiales bacterium]